jgi:catalase
VRDQHSQGETVPQNGKQPIDDEPNHLTPFRADDRGEKLTTNQGLRIQDDQNSLKGGERGPSLLEDFHLREKITHFDHERIPERVVHARGAAAHGFFQVYESLARYTRAGFLQDPSRKTPVFVRFSTVAGSRGSSDLARDVRGFAVKFYTDEGNFDLVGNNIPVFFIQDAMKFPDLIHAVKPEPNNEIPQAASAHDTFWDFISMSPESAHMIMWVMSDRAIPRSFRMMEGFGVHTFRLINAAGESRFVKFHWKPLLGVHSIVWDEALKISGQDPDFHRRDLWDAIEAGAYPEWELGLQIIEEKDEHAFDFDLLDPTKLIPEELVPVERVGKLTLNRNPDNFFAETEQVAFHPGHVVSGIDFSNDPLLQGRLFSYLDTQLSRLGGPNFAQIPINLPVAPVHNNQRDGHMQQAINVGTVSYEPNSINGNTPAQATAKEGGFHSYAEPMSGAKMRSRSEKFFDFFSQATLFYRSQSEPEQQHIVQALRFELGKVERPAIRERMLTILAQIDRTLANRVAEGLGLAVPRRNGQVNFVVPADARIADYQPRAAEPPAPTSAALSMATTPKDSIMTRKVAVLATDGVDDAALKSMQETLSAGGAQAKIVATHGGEISTASGARIKVDFTFLTAGSVLFDAVYVPDGRSSAQTLAADPKAVHFINESFNHCKTIGASGAGVDLLQASALGAAILQREGVVVAETADRMVGEFATALAQHRHWSRERGAPVPA